MLIMDELIARAAVKLLHPAGKGKGSAKDNRVGFGAATLPPTCRPCLRRQDRSGATAGACFQPDKWEWVMGRLVECGGLLAPARSVFDCSRQASRGGGCRCSDMLAGPP